MQGITCLFSVRKFVNIQSSLIKLLKFYTFECKDFKSSCMVSTHVYYIFYL
nr:MAG TPA: hypothetical protein [Caudoviricetes sp.]